MVATFSEGIDSVISVLSDWNRGNTDNIKPIIQDIASIGPERGKRLDLSRHDFILVFETAHNEETPELLYDFVRRLIHVKRKGDGTNFDRLVFKTRTDLSDRTKRLFRMTFQIEVVIFAELIP